MAIHTYGIDFKALFHSKERNIDAVIRDALESIGVGPGTRVVVSKPIKYQVDRRSIDGRSELRCAGCWEPISFPNFECGESGDGICWRAMYTQDMAMGRQAHARYLLADLNEMYSDDPPEKPPTQKEQDTIIRVWQMLSEDKIPVGTIGRIRHGGKSIGVELDLAAPNDDFMIWIDLLTAIKKLSLAW